MFFSFGTRHKTKFGKPAGTSYIQIPVFRPSDSIPIELVAQQTIVLGIVLERMVFRIEIRQTVVGSKPYIPIGFFPNPYDTIVYQAILRSI